MVQFWYSDQARGMLENATSLATGNYRAELNRVGLETRTMSGDLAEYLDNLPIDSNRFSQGLGYQLFRRNLSEALILQVNEAGNVQPWRW